MPVYTKPTDPIERLWRAYLEWIQRRRPWEANVIEMVPECSYCATTPEMLTFTIHYRQAQHIAALYQLPRYQLEVLIQTYRLGHNDLITIEEQRGVLPGLLLWTELNDHRLMSVEEYYRMVHDYRLYRMEPALDTEK